MVSEERLQEVVDLVLEKGLEAICEQEGLSRRTVVRYLELAISRGIDGAEDAWGKAGLKHRQRYRGDEKGKASWELRDGFVVFKGLHSVSEGTWEIPQTELEEVYWEYSREGEGLQVNQVCRRHNIPRSIFLECQSILGLTHTSPPFPPWRFESATEEELAQITLERRQRAYELKLLEQKDAWAEKKLKEVLDRKVLEDRIVEAVVERLEPLPYHPFKGKAIKSSPRAVGLHLADVHLGMKTDGRENLLSDDYSVDIVKTWMERLKERFRQELSQHPKVEQGFLFDHGDFFDGIIARIFKGQELLQDVRGEEAVLLGLQLKRDLIGFMAELLPKLYVVVVDGNHDGPRSTRVWMPRFNYMAGKILEHEFSQYKHVKFVLPGGDVACVRYGDALIVVMHGTGFKGAETKRKLKFLSLLDGIDMRDVEYVYLVMGHYHAEWLREVLGHKIIVVPAFAASSDYVAEVYWDRHRPAQLMTWLDRTEGLVGVNWLYLDNGPKQKVIPVKA